MQKKIQETSMEKLDLAIADLQKSKQSLAGVEAHKKQLIANGNDAEEKLIELESSLDKLPDERKQILSSGADIAQLKALNIKEVELKAEIKALKDISEYNLNHSDLDPSIIRELKDEVNSCKERINDVIHDQVLEDDVKPLMPILIQAFSFRCLSSEFTRFQSMNELPTGYGRDGFGDYMARLFRDYISKEFGPVMDDINNVGPRSFTTPFLKSDPRFKDLDIH